MVRALNRDITVTQFSDRYELHCHKLDLPYNRSSGTIIYISYKYHIKGGLGQPHRTGMICSDNDCINIIQVGKCRLMVSKYSRYAYNVL